MKKLLDIIKLQQLHQCYQLQLDYKTQRHNLKRYLKSLKQLKSRLKDNHNFIANLTLDAMKMTNQQGSLKKKFSQMDYYLINGIKVFKGFGFETKKLQTFYNQCLIKSKDLTQRIIKYLDQSKQSYLRVSKQHQKVIKQYSAQCFPQTTTILFKIGFTNPDKIQKSQDILKQQSILRETHLYTNVLNNYLDQMQSLKLQTQQLFKQYYMAGTNLWIECCENLRIQYGTYTINQSELEQYYQETGGAMTDRSDRSVKGGNQRSFNNEDEI